MELWKELIRKTKEEMGEKELTEDTIKAIIESKCYYMLDKIRDIIKDDETSDEECFDKIEEIVCLFEKMAIDFGSRHDFG